MEYLLITVCLFQVIIVGFMIALYSILRHINNFLIRKFYDIELSLQPNPDNDD